MRTGPITFDVRDRGRKFRGQDRNYDTAALAALINSGPVQERVRKRDLHGYFGHWPRVMFGLHPGEGGVLDGKQITLEPATVTVGLSATPDGVITHEAEFLDTAPGRTAKRMWASKAGGFSSAMDCAPGAGGAPDVPRDFAGFDYVLEPNFSGNRGWSLDSALGERQQMAAFMDGVAAESQATVRALDGQLNMLQSSYDSLLMRSAQQANEISELVAMLAKVPGAREAAARRLATLDAVPVPGVRTVSRMDSARLVLQAKQFAKMDLAGVEDLPQDVEVQRQQQREFDAIERQAFGRHL